MRRNPLRTMALAAALSLPWPAIAGEACVAVKPSDEGDERKYEIWLERGPQTDFTYAWSCVAKTETSTSEASNSSFAFRKAEQDDKLGACSALVDPPAAVKITVDLWLSPNPAPNAPRTKVGKIVFDFDSSASAKEQRQCRPF
jgi:hypothetical protein